MRKLLDLVTGKTPVSKMLDQYKIPRPSTLLAGLIAIRLAALSKASHCDREFIHVNLEVGDNRVIHVRSWVKCDAIVDLKVGMPGSPTYQSVDLDAYETRAVGDALLDLWRRIHAQRVVNRDAESQTAAINMIEKFL